MDQVMANYAELVWLFCGLLLFSSAWIVLHLQRCLRAISRIDGLREAAAGVSERLDSYEVLMREAEQRSFEQSLKTGINPSNILFDVRRKMNSVRDLLNEIGGALESGDEYAISLASDALDTLLASGGAEGALSPWEVQLQALIEQVMAEIDVRHRSGQNSKVNEAA